MAHLVTRRIHGHPVKGVRRSPVPGNVTTRAARLAVPRSDRPEASEVTTRTRESTLATIRNAKNR
jgi:hypothetical protein